MLITIKGKIKLDIKPEANAYILVNKFALKGIFCQIYSYFVAFSRICNKINVAHHCNLLLKVKPQLIIHLVSITVALVTLLTASTTILSEPGETNKFEL